MLLPGRSVGCCDLELEVFEPAAIADADVVFARRLVASTMGVLGKQKVLWFLVTALGAASCLRCKEGLLRRHDREGAGWVRIELCG